MPSTVLVVNRLLLPTKLLSKGVLARDDADLLAKFGRLGGQRVDMKTVTCRLSTGLAECLDEGLLLLGCDGCVTEEDDTSLRAVEEGVSDGTRGAVSDTHTRMAKSRSFSASFKTSRTLKVGFPPRS